MAVTGLLFAAFVAVHMVGNLKAYFGAESYNSYSLWLRTAFYPLLPHEGLLWIMRVVLGVALVLHVVAACPNGSAHLFAGAKLAHLALLPQPSQERGRRVKAMMEVLEAEFGPCSTYGECVKVCPAGIDLAAVAAVHRERLRASVRGRDD